MDRPNAAGGQRYLVGGEAQRPQGAVVSVHGFQEVSRGQLEDLQLPALRRETLSVTRSSQDEAARVG